MFWKKFHFNCFNFKSINFYRFALIILAKVGLQTSNFLSFSFKQLWVMKMDFSILTFNRAAAAGDAGIGTLPHGFAVNCKVVFKVYTTGSDHFPRQNQWCNSLFQVRQESLMSYFINSREITMATSPWRHLVVLVSKRMCTLEKQSLEGIYRITELWNDPAHGRVGSKEGQGQMSKENLWTPFLKEKQKFPFKTPLFVEQKPLSAQCRKIKKTQIDELRLLISTPSSPSLP